MTNDSQRRHAPTTSGSARTTFNPDVKAGAPTSRRVRRKQTIARTANLKRDLRLDQYGLPCPEPEEVKLPPIPPTANDPLLRREVLLGQVELLLIHGMIRPSRIARRLGIHQATAKRYINAIHLRWLTRGDDPQVTLVRAQARKRLQLIAEELWRRIGESDSDAIQVAALKHLIAVHDRMMVLDNLTPESLERLDRHDIADTDTKSRLPDPARMKELGDALRRYVVATASTPDTSGREPS